ncbi:AAA family ATPase [Paenibacillus sp. D2_2]|uniref:AAA family ATPase n=1 Tax=Paenibacillus sp. D2_2 TaxID=3073092 RepID=UPI0028166C8A|nr:AAA family ATPase [Paenibacillus sp. D2_2]WMT40482.1 AAA family ATPase [Paenibacillus sp. D2_2]
MIRIDKIKIENYRKFSDEDIYFDKSLTAIAGSNNAGKTSIVELLSTILVPGKSMNIDDMSYNAQKKTRIY